jgi:hypothetical protein
MQSVNYTKQLYRSFKRNIESCSELYCLINDSLDLQLKKASSGKEIILIPTSGFERTGADLIIILQRIHITLDSKYSSGSIVNAPLSGPGFGSPIMNHTTGGIAGYGTSIKLSAVISVFSIKESRVLFTREIKTTKRGSNPHTFSKKDVFHVQSPTDEAIEKEGNVGNNEIEEAVQYIARKLIKNTPWEIKNKHPQKEIVE